MACGPAGACVYCEDDFSTPECPAAAKKLSHNIDRCYEISDSPRNCAMSLTQVFKEIVLALSNFERVFGCPRTMRLETTCGASLLFVAHHFCFQISY